MKIEKNGVVYDITDKFTLKVFLNAGFCEVKKQSKQKPAEQNEGGSDEQTKQSEQAENPA